METICPLKFTDKTLDSGGSLAQDRPESKWQACACEGEKCAWWHPNAQKCCILVLSFRP